MASRYLNLEADPDDDILLEDDSGKLLLENIVADYTRRIKRTVSPSVKLFLAEAAFLQLDGIDGYVVQEESLHYFKMELLSG